VKSRISSRELGWSLTVGFNVPLDTFRRWPFWVMSSFQHYVCNVSAMFVCSKTMHKQYVLL